MGEEPELQFFFSIWHFRSRPAGPPSPNVSCYASRLVQPPSRLTATFSILHCGPTLSHSLILDAFTNLSVSSFSILSAQHPVLAAYMLQKATEGREKHDESKLFSGSLHFT